VQVGRREWVEGVVDPAAAADADSGAAQDDRHAASPATVVYVGVEGRGVIGSLAFRDSLR